MNGTFFPVQYCQRFNSRRNVFRWKTAGMNFPDSTMNFGNPGSIISTILSMLSMTYGSEPVGHISPTTPACHPRHFVGTDVGTMKIAN